MIEKDAFGFLLVIVLMTLVVYFTRIVGYWLIGRFVIGPRLRRMLEALPGAVIAATLAPTLVHGGMRSLVALAATALVMTLIRKDFLAVFTGAAVAAAVFAVSP